VTLQKRNACLYEYLNEEKFIQLLLLPLIDHTDSVGSDAIICGCLKERRIHHLLKLGLDKDRIQ
jgi:hypothetical protein